MSLPKRLRRLIDGKLLDPIRALQRSPERLPLHFTEEARRHPIGIAIGTLRTKAK